MSVRPFFIALAAALVLSLMPLAQTAGAADLCLDATGGGAVTAVRPIIIGRSFTIPGKNKCKPLKGVFVGRQSAVTGVACTSFDGSHASFTLTAGIAPPIGFFALGTFVYSVNLTLATLSGTLSDEGGNTSVPVIAYQCKKIYPDNL